MKNFEVMKKYGLTFAELKVWESLFYADGEPVHRSKICKAIGNDSNDHLISRSVDVHVSNLRKKIKSEYEILKARGIGYFMEKV